MHFLLQTSREIAQGGLVVLGGWGPHGSTRQALGRLWSELIRWTRCFPVALQNTGVSVDTESWGVTIPRAPGPVRRLLPQLSFSSVWSSLPLGKHHLAVSSGLQDSGSHLHLKKSKKKRKRMEPGDFTGHGATLAQGRIFGVRGRCVTRSCKALAAWRS